MNEPYVGPHAALVKRNRWLVPAGISAVLLAPILATVGIVAFMPILTTLVPLFLVGGVTATALALRSNPWTHDAPAEIEAGDAGIHVDGELTVPRGRITGGFVVPDFPCPRVRIERRRQLPLEIRVGDEDEGRKLLRALGLDASQRAATFFTPSRAATDGRYSMALGLGIVALVLGTRMLGHVAGVALPGIQLPVILLVSLGMLLMRTKIVVGADGLLRSWLGRKTFYSYADVEHVGTYAENSFWKKQKWRGVELRLRSGEVVRLPVSSQQSFDHTRVRLIAERVREAMESHRRGDPAADEALLARRDRPVAEWIQSLRAVGSGARLDHRTAPVLPEKLWRIVEDPSAAPAARAGAAVVLSSAGDEGSRYRLKDAAEAVASPRLRVAIEAAAGSDEAALTEALAELDEAAPGATRKA